MKVEIIEKAPDKNLYEQVAERIRSLIVEGTLKEGDRIPSVRKLHQQLSVSISTVLEAYRVLENQGWIGVRPQSGYYVMERNLPILEQPSEFELSKLYDPVDVSLAFRVSAAMREPDNVKLGAAIPGVELLPTAALNRIMGQVLRANSETAHSVHSYHPPQGCEQLRYEVAKRLIHAGCIVSPNEIVITNGATEALYLSLKAVTKPGDTIAIESPTYYGLLEIMESLCLKALELPTHPQEGLSLAHLEMALQQQKIAAVALVSNFSNPLGSCMSDCKKKQLVGLLERYNLPLIEDDIYGELYFEGNRPKAIKAFDTQGLVLYCSSVSKTVSPGLRVGWLVGGKYQIKVEQLKMATNWMTAIAPQLTVATFLANGYDRHLYKLRRAYQNQMARMKSAICQYFPTETKVTRPGGGFVLWLEFPDRFDAMVLYEEARSHKISVAPGNMFSPSGNYRHCLRLNAGLPFTVQIETAMETLGNLIKKQVCR
jgi:DNA-binding transcriptional MocR family regulator